MAEWGASAVAQRLLMLTERIADGLGGFGVGVPERRWRAPHILSLSFKSLDFKNGMPTGLVEGLATEGIYVAARLGRMRISPHVYNDEADADRFVAALVKRSGASPPTKTRRPWRQRVRCCATNGRMTQHDESAVEEFEFLGAPLNTPLATISADFRTSRDVYAADLLPLPRWSDPARRYAPTAVQSPQLGL